MRRLKPGAIDAVGQSAPAPLAQGFGWFGKLPGAGDFVSRRLPYAVQQFWDGWCAAGVEALKAGSTAQGVSVWNGIPAWGFVVPSQPGVPGAQVGVFAPSCDRVGRIFPFVVAAPLVPGLAQAVLGRAALLALAWADVVQHAQAARLGVDEVDAGLHVAFSESLGGEGADGDDAATLPQGLETSSLPWPDLVQRFDPGGPDSYWWSVPPSSTGFQVRVYSGPLRAAHLLDLCRPKDSDGSAG